MKTLSPAFVALAATVLSALLGNRAAQNRLRELDKNLQNILGAFDATCYFAASEKFEVELTKD